MKIKKLFAAFFVVMMSLVATESSFAQQKGKWKPIEPEFKIRDTLKGDEYLEPNPRYIQDTVGFRSNDPTSLYSKNGNYRLQLQKDGNLVLYQGETRETVMNSGERKTYRLYVDALWSTKTNGQAVRNAVMQTDGNLVLYSPDGKAVWNSKTHKNNNSALILQNDGNLVIYNPNSIAIWNTKTNQKYFKDR